LEIEKMRNGEMVDFEGIRVIIKMIIKAHEFYCEVFERKFLEAARRYCSNEGHFALFLK
jgi:hypothetical protein